MKLITSVLSLLLLWCISSFPVWGLTDREIEQDLNLLNETELAYGVALQVAQAEASYAGWKRVITQYPHQDHIHHHAYLNAWQAAVQRNEVSVYADFMTLRPDSSLNAWAVHHIYELVKAEDTVSGYVNFIEGYPDSIEAVAAWQRIQHLAFAKAQQQNKVAAYDEFIQAFMQAEHTDLQLLEQAMQSALSIEKARIIAEYLDGETEPTHDNWQQRERAARTLYNIARHSNTSELVAMRNMQLLNSDLFMDTKVVTEKFDRAELMDHQQRLETKLDAVKQSVDNMHESLLQGLREHTEVLQQERQKLQETIAQYDEWMHIQQIQFMTQAALIAKNQPFSKSSSNSSNVAMGDIVVEMLPPIPFVPPALVKITTVAVIKSVQKVGNYLAAK